jgi:hypothetical protein
LRRRNRAHLVHQQIDAHNLAILSAFLSNGVAGAPPWLVGGLTVPASIGEFWMVGFLLAVGIRPASKGVGEGQ